MGCISLVNRLLKERQVTLKLRVWSLGSEDSLGVLSPYVRGLGKAEDEVDLNTGISDFAEGKFFKA